MQILQTTAVKKEQQFEVNLLWRNKQVLLPDSYEVACHRQKPQLYQTMQVHIDKILLKG